MQKISKYLPRLWAHKTRPYGCDMGVPSEFSAADDNDDDDYDDDSALYDLMLCVVIILIQT